MLLSIRHKPTRAVSSDDPTLTLSNLAAVPATRTGRTMRATLTGLAVMATVVGLAAPASGAGCDLSALAKHHIRQPNNNKIETKGYAIARFDPATQR